MIDDAKAEGWIGPYLLECWNEWAKHLVHDSDQVRSSRRRQHESNEKFLAIQECVVGLRSVPDGKAVVWAEHAISCGRCAVGSSRLY